jgi:hypothetical protein
MVRLISIGIVALLAAEARPDQTVAPSGPVAQVVARLRGRHAPIRVLSCRFSVSRTPSLAALRDYEEGAGLPCDDAREQFGLRKNVRFLEASGERFWLEVVRLDVRSRPSRVERLGYDGTATWRQLELPPYGSAPQPRPADVTTEFGSEPLAGDYEAATSPKWFLGDSILPSSEPVHARIAADPNAELLADSPVDGSPCVVIRWRSATDGAGRRHTLWLDKARGLAVRRSLEETSVSGRGWVVTATGRIPEVGITHFTTDSGATVEYHYPKTILTESFDLVDPENTVVGRFDIEEVRINPWLAADPFNPRVDEGTGILDRDTGRYSISGGGATPALKGLVSVVVEQARRRAYETSAFDASVPRSSVPVGHGLLAAVAAGVIGLVVTVTLRAGTTRWLGPAGTMARRAITTWLTWFAGTLSTATGLAAVLSTPAPWTPATPADLAAPWSQAAAEKLNPLAPPEQETPERRRDVAGPVALACAAAYAGRPELFDAAFGRFPLDGGRHTLANLQATAAGLGLVTRAACWRPGGRPEFHGPAILRMDPLGGAGSGHLLVALEATGSRLLILDLPHAPEWVPTEKLWEAWDGVALHVATSEVGLPPRRSAGRRTLVCVVAVALGLSVLVVAGIERANVRPGRPAARSLIASAIAVAVMVAPALGEWGVDRMSPVSRPALQAVPTFLPLRVDALIAETVGPRGIVAAYRILNRGDRPAIIERVETSCGCIATTLSSSTIPARGSVGLSIRIQPARDRPRALSARVVFREPAGHQLEVAGKLTVSPGHRDPRGPLPALLLEVQSD